MLIDEDAHRIPARRQVAALLEVTDVRVSFRRAAADKRSRFMAVDGVSLSIRQGETLGLAGESGSGKSTLGYAILGHHPCDSGTVSFEGQDITNATGDARRRLRRHMQMVFQDPFSSLNPRMRIAEAVAEPLIAHHVGDRASREARVEDLLDRCGLPGGSGRRFPDAFSGGQRQRIAIARALALTPRLIVADEPTSALDVSVQAQLVNLLTDLQDELGLAYLFISHNLAVLRHVSDRIAIMFAGRIVETAPTEELFANPSHPYTVALLSALPVLDPESGWLERVDVVTTDTTTRTEAGQGCSYASRCPSATDLCWGTAPPTVEIHPGHHIDCWHPVGISDARGR